MRQEFEEKETVSLTSEEMNVLYWKDCLQPKGVKNGECKFTEIQTV